MTNDDLQFNEQLMEEIIEKVLPILCLLEGKVRVLRTVAGVRDGCWLHATAESACSLHVAMHQMAGEPGVCAACLLCIRVLVGA